VDIVTLLDSFHTGDSFRGTDHHHRVSRTPRTSVTDEGLPRSRINSAGSELSTSPANDPMMYAAHAHEDPVEDTLHAGFREVSLPKSTTMRVFPTVERVSPTGDTNYRAEQLYSKTYGRSLLSGFSDTYVPDVVLQGAPQMTFMPSIIEDLKRSVNVTTIFSLQNQSPPPPPFLTPHTISCSTTSSTSLFVGQSALLGIPTNCKPRSMFPSFPNDQKKKKKKKSMRGCCVFSGGNPRN